MTGPSEYHEALILIAGTVGVLLFSGAIVLLIVIFQKGMFQVQVQRRQFALEILNTILQIEASNTKGSKITKTLPV